MAYSKITFPHYGMADRKVIEFCGSWAIGSTGAVGAKTSGTGLTLTRNDVGKYTVQIVGVEDVATGVPAMPVAMAFLHNTDTNPGGDTDAHAIYGGAKSASDGTFVFQCVDEAGTAAEAPSGAVIDVFIKAQMTS